MPVLTVSNLRHAYGTRVILDGATTSIEAGEKVGLVGRNGQGKTTLMKAIIGTLEPDGGSVQLQRGARVGYLSQHVDLDPEDTVREAAERAFTTLHDLHARAAKLYEEMAAAEGDALERLLKQQARIEAEIEAAGGYAIDHKIDAMLHGLGFSDAQFTQAVGSLSGGQKGAPRARAPAARGTGRPAARRTDEPPGHRWPSVARGVPRRGLQRGRHRREP